jgi:hypothetical protein
MKKIFILLALIGFAISVNAQNTVPRFGITPDADNTGRVLTYKLSAPADVAGKDTFTVSANAFQTFVVPASNIVDSVAYLANVTNCYLGDKVTFILTKGTGTGTALFLGGNWLMTTASTRVSLPASKKVSITFVFTGTKWLEVARTTQVN